MQQQEIVEMQSWLQAWYNRTHEPEMTPGDMNKQDQLAALRGAEFEIECMKRMIRHHGKAVVRATQCLDQAFHAELERLCENISETQLAEIVSMRLWLQREAPLVDRHMFAEARKTASWGTHCSASLLQDVLYVTHFLSA